MKRAAILLALAGCGGGASSERVAALEARVSALGAAVVRNCQAIAYERAHRVYGDGKGGDWAAKAADESRACVDRYLSGK